MISRRQFIASVAVLPSISLLTSTCPVPGKLIPGRYQNKGKLIPQTKWACEAVVIENPGSTDRDIKSQYNKSLPEYGDLYLVKKFRQWCGDSQLIDYDGDGHPVKDGLMNSKILIKPSKYEEIPEDATHLMWFNR